MPRKDIRKKLRRATILYWTLLTYIVAALVWWFISLERQNDVMRDLKISRLRSSVDSVSAVTFYDLQLKKINSDHKKNRTKYVGEGVIFLLVICVGAMLVYRYVQRQFDVQQQQQ